MSVRSLNFWPAGLEISSQEVEIRDRDPKHTGVRVFVKQGKNLEQLEEIPPPQHLKVPRFNGNKPPKH